MARHGLVELWHSTSFLSEGIACPGGATLRNSEARIGEAMQSNGKANQSRAKQRQSKPMPVGALLSNGKAIPGTAMAKHR